VALAEALAPPPPPAAPLVAVGARVAAPDAHALAERHAEGEAQPFAEAVAEGLPEGERLPGGERDAEALTERDAVVLTEALRFAAGVAVCEREARGEGGRRSR
jgi:hypothetical protein